MVSLGMFSVVPPTEPCALRSTQPLKVSTRDFSWGKGGRCVWLTTYHPCSAETLRKSGTLIYPEPRRPPRPVAGDLYFYYSHRVWTQLWLTTISYIIFLLVTAAGPHMPKHIDYWLKTIRRSFVGFNFWHPNTKQFESLYEYLPV